MENQQAPSAIINEGIIFLVSGFCHWGGSKLERASEMEIVSSPWDDKKCTKIILEVLRVSSL